MSISRIKQIKQIIAHSDVRDPRATLIAIEDVLKRERSKTGEVLLKVKAIRNFNGAVEVGVTSFGITPRELFGVIQSLKKHGDELFGVDKAQKGCAENTADAEISCKMKAVLDKIFGAAQKGGV